MADLCSFLCGSNGDKGSAVNSAGKVIVSTLLNELQRRYAPNFRPPNTNPPGALVDQILASRKSDVQKLSTERRQDIAVSGITAPTQPGQ